MSITPKCGHVVALSLLDILRYRRNNLLPNGTYVFPGRPAASFRNGSQAFRKRSLHRTSSNIVMVKPYYRRVDCFLKFVQELVLRTKAVDRLAEIPLPTTKILTCPITKISFSHHKLGRRAQHNLPNFH